MAQRDPNRRPRGSATEAVGLYVEVAPDVKAAVDELAAATCMPKWRVVEALIRSADLDKVAAEVRAAADKSNKYVQEEMPLLSA